MIPELGYYLVVTDTEATERCYFQGLHKELPKEVQNKLVINTLFILLLCYLKCLFFISCPEDFFI